MEHVPLPSNCTTQTVKIPLLTKDEWDGKDFLAYPDRVGWRDAMSKRSWNQNPDPFIQTWLFFGLISAIFGRKATFAEFTFEESRDIFITTNALKDRNRWRIQSDEPGNTTTSGLLRAITCLKEAKHAFFTFVQSNCGYEITPNLALSISTTAEFMCALVFQEFGQKVPIDIADGPVLSTKFALKPDIWNIESLTPEEISESYAKFSSFTCQDWAHKNGNSYSCRNMRSNNWCLKKAVRCLLDFNATAAYYASHFDNPSPVGNHTECTSTYCSVSNLDEDSYKTSHTNIDCSCKDLRATDVELSPILTGKTFPLIVLSEHLEDNVSLNLQEYRRGTLFVAISHVWSDGLGNPWANSLPRCQLSRISKSVKQLCGPKDSLETPFWIDTICCPFRPGNAQDRAISKMKDTYALAEWVLVFDSWLMSQDIGGLTDTEILLRIACSNWNERLWTLQEGILAQKLAFQFRDDVYRNAKDAIHRIAHGMWLNPGSSEHCLRANLLNQYDHFFGLKNMGDTKPAMKLLALRDTLKFRGTSVPSDEALCLGTLLGFEMMPIIQTAQKDRMRVFWSMFSEIPTQFIFGGAKRLNQKGYGWAPETLRHPLAEGPQMVRSPFCTTEQRLREPQTSPRRIEGLRIQTPGFLLDASRHSLRSFFWFFDEDKNLYAAEFSPVLPGISFETGSIDHERSHGPQKSIDPWEGIGKESTDCIALICVYTPDSMGRFPVEDFYNAVLVTVLKQADQLLITKFVRSIRLSYNKNDDNIRTATSLLNTSAHNRRTGLSLKDGSILVVGEARLLKNQTWRIV